jgi:hypothetical protein
MKPLTGEGNEVRMRAWLVLINRKIKSFCANIYYDMAAAIIAGVILYFAFAASAKITAPAADDFFSSYFGGVIHSSQRHLIYEHEVTASYRRFEDWPTYKKFWKNESG